MSKGQVCDKCHTTETNFTEVELYWLTVGFLDGERYDACSLACARALLDDEVAASVKRMELTS